MLKILIGRSPRIDCINRWRSWIWSCCCTPNFLGLEHQQNVEIGMQNKNNVKQNIQVTSRDISNWNQTFRTSLTSIILKLFLSRFFFFFRRLLDLCFSTPSVFSFRLPSQQLLQSSSRWLDWSKTRKPQWGPGRIPKSNTPLFLPPPPPSFLIVSWYFTSILGFCHGARLKR